MENWEIERDKKAERVKLLHTLKSKYEGKNPYITTIKKVAEENNLNALEIEYIFFEDALLQRIATI